MSLVDDLAALKAVFGRDAAARCARLLTEARSAVIEDPRELIRLHETILFLRAYPQSAKVAALADTLLFAFADRLRGIDPWPFEEGEVSGIAGSALSTNYSHAFARRLLAVHEREFTIDWDNYEHADRLGAALARITPYTADDWAVESHIDVRAWWDASGLTLRSLLERLDPQVYDLLEIPLLWTFGSSSATRSRTRLPREIFYHREPLIARRDVSIAAEFAALPIAFRRLKRAEARDVLDTIAATSAARYRELWGFLYPDEARVEHADFGRGVDLYWCGVPPAHRLPVRAYHCGMFFKNGVPIGYVETLSLFERAEVGFNLYYTFREGESAWLYARLLKYCRQRLGVTCFSIDPYQIGHGNEEAVASGAYWFYRKLGFRPASAENARLTEREEQRIASQPGYRTPAATLRKLASAPLVYGGGEDWDGFSLRRALQRLGTRKLWPPRIAKAKRAADEREFLRLLRESPALRRRLLRLGAP